MLVNYSSDEDSDMRELAGRGVDAAPQLHHEVADDLDEIPPSSAKRVFLDRASQDFREAGAEKKRKRRNTKRPKGNVEDVYWGPWADFEAEKGPAEGVAAPEEPEEEESQSEDPEEPIAPKASTLMSSNAHYMDLPPTKINLSKLPGSQECFVPKKIIHTYEGHTKGTSKIRFFPVTGHLLLSCGNDAVVRLWDIYRNRELLREYCGHTETVKDVIFNSTGETFLSCSFDKTVLLWSTETGEILKTIKVPAVPTSLQFNPNNESEFIVGLMNNKIEHYNLDGSHIQTYDHHLSGISSLTVIDNNQKFLSTAYDKSVIIWKWGINIPPKSIALSSLYAVASVAVLPPFGKFIALQDMRDSIQVIEGTDRFRTRNKTFKNNNITGCKIDIDFSPDGKILCSGDSKGNALFWDWQNTKLIAKLKLSNKLITTIKYHPQEQSKVAAAGTDGKIYYCD